MNKINFFPIYRELIENGKMTTRFSLGDKTEEYKPGKYILTFSYPEIPEVRGGEIEITSAVLKKIKDLQYEDFYGQSPEINTIEETCVVLSHIYRKTVSPSDYITVIKWSPLKMYKQDKKVYHVQRNRA